MLIMDNDQILEYLQEQAQLVEAISTPKGLLVNKDKLNLDELMSKYSNDNRPINNIRYKILEKLKSGQVFSLDELLELKTKNGVSKGNYETYLSYTYTFLGDTPRKQLKSISTSLIKDLGIGEKYKATCSAFDGSRHSGENRAWVALHLNNRSFMDSWQFFLDIYPNVIECGKHSGKNLYDEYKIECEPITSYEQILNVLNKKKNEIFQLNNELEKNNTPADRIKTLTWWQISAIGMYSNDKSKQYKPVDVENLPFVQQAKIIKGQSKPSIATELRECSDDYESKYNRKGRNYFERYSDYYKLSNEGIKYVEENFSAFLINPNIKIKTDYLDDVYISNYECEHLKELITNKKNVILQGPPGVGKTFVAKKLAYSLMEEKDDSRVKMIQFHQSYSYEDFIMGYKPTESGKFKLTEGPFYRFCKKAQDNPGQDYFFIIDEINRGNLSRIFGELMMLIELDKRGQELDSLTYSEDPFTVPKNFHLIGTMNTADRSLAMIDYALRRRFAFYEMKPAFENENFDAFLNQNAPDEIKSLIGKIKELNEEIKNDCTLGVGFMIGHSYFCNDLIKDKSGIDSIIKYEILPLIKEYWFDNEKQKEKWEQSFRELLDDKK